MGYNQVRGSSPLTRGKLWAADHSITSAGLIPAHAGKTHGRRAARAGPRAHPRSRGENLQRLVIISMQAGSSPLTRGKHMGVERRGPGRGLIPAHAGKTEDML